MKAAPKVSVPFLAVLVSLTNPIASLAQDARISPLLEPVIAQLPAVPSGAQKSYDPLTVEQLMKMVDLSRTIGGGISQLFQTIVDQSTSIDRIRDAQIGSRQIPLNNNVDDALMRQGGVGLKEMADGALSGNLDAPLGVISTFRDLRTAYNLDSVFVLKDGDEQTSRFIASASAQGGVASAIAEESYKRANAGMKRLDSYIKATAESADLKTSVDINTRVMVELTQQLNESLRLQAAMTSMIGTYFMMMGGEAGRVASPAGK